MKLVPKKRKKKDKKKIEKKCMSVGERQLMAVKIFGNVHLRKLNK